MYNNRFSTQTLHGFRVFHLPNALQLDVPSVEPEPLSDAPLQYTYLVFQ